MKKGNSDPAIFRMLRRKRNKYIDQIDQIVTYIEILATYSEGREFA